MRDSGSHPIWARIPIPARLVWFSRASLPWAGTEWREAISQEAFQFYAIGFCEHGLEQVAQAFDAFGHVVEAEVFDGEAVFDFLPGHGGGDGSAGLRAHGIDRGEC